MIYALLREAQALAGDLSKYSIEVNPRRGFIVMPDRAIKIDTLSSRDQCRKILRDCIDELKSQVDAQQKRKQASLF
jgi:hypothetical protein